MGASWMTANLYWVIASLLFLCLLWASVMFYKYPSWALAMLLPLLAWLMFDPLVLAVGNLLGEGATLQVLSYLRYLLRALATPFLLIIAFDQAKRARIKWMDDPLMVLVLGVVVLGLLVLGVVNGFMSVNLEVTELEDIKQYKEDEPLGLPLAAIATLTMITSLGCAFFFKTRSPWLLFGGLLMLIGLVVPVLPAVVIAATSVALVVGFLLTEIKLHQIAPNPAIR
jgi:phosphatidylglycerophosphatase A